MIFGRADRNPELPGAARSLSICRLVVLAPWLLALPLWWLASPAQAARILLIGDSITRGAVGGGGEGAPYAELVAAAFPNQEVINAGCDGSSTGDWVRPGLTLSCAFRGAFELLAEPNLPAEFVSIMLGTNDAVGFFEPNPGCCPVPIETYRSNLDALVAHLLPSADWIFLMTAPKNPSPHPDIAERLLGYRDEVLDLCSAPDDRVLCGPDVHQLLDVQIHLAGVHPNSLGHMLIADALIEDLALLVPEPSTALLLGIGLLASAMARRRGLR